MIINCEDLVNGVKAFDNEECETSMRLLKPLADKGCAQAQCYVGSMYMGGFGVAIDVYEAVKWLKLSAEQEEMEGKVSAISYNNLASIYSSGLEDIGKDSELAKKYWKKSEKLGFDMIPKIDD